MSQLKHPSHGALGAPATALPEHVAGAPDQALQHVNEDVAAARHLTAIRIRGQLAEPDGEASPA
ncbi:hypothetical protein [Herbaspirillum sp. NPDC087042]|uniref:hypothetical protein n=1 Tax=Herbaspirillum sp. NPDC087042 TaxID=3364004 RepID=UPI0037F5D0B2